MPYEFPEGKLHTVVVLRWIERRQSAMKDAVCVYDVADMLEDLGVVYEDAGHRLNDASQRLRTLFKSGYVKKVLAGYDDSGVSSAACFSRVGKIAAGRGRKPDVYVLTERGLRYGRTSADAYLDADGGALERRVFIERLLQARGAAWIVGEVDLRAAVLTRDAEKAVSAARGRMRSLVESERFLVDGSTYSSGEAPKDEIEGEGR